MSFGELKVDIVQILGLFTGIAAFVGCFMTANYLFTSVVYKNPMLFVIGT